MEKLNELKTEAVSVIREKTSNVIGYFSENLEIISNIILWIIIIAVICFIIKIIFACYKVLIEKKTKIIETIEEHNIRYIISESKNYNKVKRSDFYSLPYFKECNSSVREVLTFFVHSGISLLFPDSALQEILGYKINYVPKSDIGIYCNEEKKKIVKIQVLEILFEADRVTKVKIRIENISDEDFKFTSKKRLKDFFGLKVDNTKLKCEDEENELKFLRRGVLKPKEFREMDIVFGKLKNKDIRKIERVSFLFSFGQGKNKKKFEKEFNYDKKDFISKEYSFDISPELFIFFMSLGGFLILEIIISIIFFLVFNDVIALILSIPVFCFLSNLNNKLLMLIQSKIRQNNNL